MTRKEAKARLKFVAEWWSPEVALSGDPGCPLQIVGPPLWWSSIEHAAHYLGVEQSWAEQFALAWDRKDAAEAMRLIEAL